MLHVKLIQGDITSYIVIYTIHMYIILTYTWLEIQGIKKAELSYYCSEVCPASTIM